MQCSSCRGQLPVGVAYCLMCGAATPYRVSQVHVGSRKRRWLLVTEHPLVVRVMDLLVKVGFCALLGLVIAVGAACGSSSTTATSATTSATPPGESAPRASWTKQAEGVCSRIYDSRGRPPKAQSGKLDDDMALAEKWHSDLAAHAASALHAIGGAPPAGVRMIGALRTYAATSLEMANVYVEGGYQPRKMAEIESRREPAKREVQSLSVSLGAPSCGKVVDTPE